MSSNDILIIIVMLVGYSVPIFLLVWVYTIALSFFRGAPYVPSRKRNHEEALRAFKLKDGDKVVDLGSGDGRFLFYAAKRYPNVHFTGVELGSTLIAYSCILSKVRGFENIEFIKGDILKTDLSEFNKIYLYLGSELNEQLASRIEKQAKDGTIVVSLTFDFGEKFMKSHDVKKIDKNPKSVSDNLYVWEKGEGQKPQKRANE